jgi:hypothetical protein
MSGQRLFLVGSIDSIDVDILEYCRIKVVIYLYKSNESLLVNLIGLHLSQSSWFALSMRYRPAIVDRWGWLVLMNGWECRDR